MKRTWTIIGVSDVASSFKWYQSLFGQRETPPGHDHFGQILDADGTVLLCLHRWGAQEHPSLMSPDETSPGNGLLLFFRVDDYEMALKRARALVDRFEAEPHVNPNTQTSDFHSGIRTDTTSRPVRSLRPSEDDPRGGGLTSACTDEGASGSYGSDVRFAGEALIVGSARRDFTAIVAVKRCRSFPGARGLRRRLARRRARFVWDLLRSRF